MRKIGYRQQRTLTTATEISGVGFITGTHVRLRFKPAAPDTGLVFIRTDLPGQPITPARADRVTNTNRRTTLGAPDTGVTLVEHVLATLAGLRIDNCVIELDGPEPPGLDGSARGFVQVVSAAGSTLQPARRTVWAVDEPMIVSHSGATIALHPPTTENESGLRASYILDYGLHSPIPRQSHTLAVTPESFAREVAGCRTFLLEQEAHALRAQGIGKHLTAAEVLVFGLKGPIDNELRYADEPARHKVLDLVGDLALCGFDVAGHLVAYRSGHLLNVALANALMARAELVGAEPVRPPRATRRQRAAA